MKRIMITLVALLLGACSATPPKDGTTFDRMEADLTRALEKRPQPGQPDAVSRALLPPLSIELPKPGEKPVDQRFDLVVSDAPASQVFMAIVSGTRYSMLVHPEVKGTLSVNLRDVTVFEALDSIRELHGYEYKVDGTRIFIQPLTLQTRVFQVNYLTGARRGSSEVFVSSSQIQGSGPGSTVTAQTTTTLPSIAAPATQSSKITTESTSDFWGELGRSLAAIVGTGDGRNVVVSPQSGVVVVRAMPNEMKSVVEYMRASRLAVGRQVMLEAKILEVQLNDGYQAGVNWAAFNRGSGARFSVGQAAAGAQLSPLNPGNPLVGGSLGSADSSGAVTGVTAGSDFGALGSAAGTLFGLALQTSNFAALLSFLDTQGNVNVLSSPRIATLNNQKAVLKVGQDELFVTNVSSTTTTGTATTTTPTVTLQSFFSGIALDVTPRIDENHEITLHIHPSVSEVQQIERVIDLSGSLGRITVPVPQSNIRETDSVVRVQDGQIVAIGGLMAQTQTEDRSGVPFLGGIPFFGAAFRQTQQASQKRELVILLKPTVIKSDQDWVDDIDGSRERLKKLDRGFSWGGKSEVFGTKGEGAAPPGQGAPDAKK